MNKDFEIDNFLKNEFKENENIDVPNEVHGALESVLKDLPKKRKSNKVRKTLIAASISGILFIGTGFAFPAFAENLPVVGDFFKVLNEKSYYKNFVNEVEKNTQDTVGKATDSNIDITLMTAVPDKTGITIGYYLKSLDGKLDMPQLWNCSVEVDGRVYKPEIDNLIHEENDEGNYHISNLIIPDLPEKFDYKLNITNITGVDGIWSFSGSLDRTDIDKQTIEKTLNIEKDTIIGKIEVKSVVKSPLYLKIVYIDHSKRNNVTFEENYEETHDDRYSRYFRFEGVKDTNWGSMSSRSDIDGLTTVIYTGFDSSLNHMDIIPVEQYSGDANIEEINLKDYIGKDVYNGKDGVLTIKDYKEEGKDKFVMVNLKVNEGKYWYSVLSKLKAGENVNRFGYVINESGPDLGLGDLKVPVGEDVWIKYPGPIVEVDKSSNSKFFIEGDKENAYIKEDTENKIRIEF